MIKIERNNLVYISSKYEKYLKEINHRANNKIYDDFSDDLEKKYILAPFSDFEQLEKDFKKNFRSEILIYETESKKDRKETEYGKFISYMERRYDTIMKYNIKDEERGDLTIGNWLAQELKVDTCPYCNRQYTFTINGKKNKIRPQFDHFYPKSIYPYFALSFYNLVPCCSICNHIKRDSNSKLLNPYDKGFGDDFYFKINHENYILNGRNIEVKFDYSNNLEKDFIEKCRNNVEKFALEDFYNMHHDYIEEIIEKAYSYNDDFYDGLRHDFSRVGKSSSEIERLIFGNYIDLADNEKRPLSKLTRDILNDIGLID